VELSGRDSGDKDCSSLLQVNAWRKWSAAASECPSACRETTKQTLIVVSMRRYVISLCTQYPNQHFPTLASVLAATPSKQAYHGKLDSPFLHGSCG
jgi:hypothetical protein